MASSSKRVTNKKVNRADFDRECEDDICGASSSKQDVTESVKLGKRENAIEWDDYFMSVAYLSAQRSKDPSTQVGACIVNEDKRIVGIGYNGFPRGCRFLAFYHYSP